MLSVPDGVSTIYVYNDTVVIVKLQYEHHESFRVIIKNKILLLITHFWSGQTLTSILVEIRSLDLERLLEHFTLVLLLNAVSSLGYCTFARTVFSPSTESYDDRKKMPWALNEMEL